MNEMEKKFCVGCDRKLTEGAFMGIGGEKIHEFKDGFYCEKCAKIKVDNARR